jgi:protein involved in polysaccharide export with SLBB domain
MIVFSASSSYGQTPEEVQKMYEEYKGSQGRSSPETIASYESSVIFEDVSVSGGELAAPKQAAPQPSVDASILKPFGYNMFTEWSADFAPPEIATVPPDYNIGPGDNLLVNMWGRVDMELNLTVNREGKVFIPKVGDIVCYGLTLEELQNRFEKKLSQVYSEFNLSVSLGKIRTIKVFVYGEVKQPGGYTLSSLSTLFNALYAARGPNERGSMRKVRLLRGGKTVRQIDLYNFLLLGDASDDVKLESEDVVFVPLAGDLITMQGEVRRPAVYEILGGERIGDAIELAGGVKPTAYTSRVMVDRVGDADNRKVIDVDLGKAIENGSGLVMKGDDHVTVFSIDQMHENFVFLSGHIKHPGTYQFEEKPTVSELLCGGDQFYDDSYLKRADLIRTNANSKQEIIPVNLEAIAAGNPDQDMQLWPKDSLIIYSVAEVTRHKFVTIKGEVTLPGRYRLYENMKLSDLIFRAGSLNRNAFLLSAEIARLNQEGVTDIFLVNLKKLMDEEDPSYDVDLTEDDQVFIRKMPDWEAERIVLVEGEFKFPGEYALSYYGETLNEILLRAGGLTDRAFPSGAVFTRAEITENLKRMKVSDIIAKSAPLETDSLGRIHSQLIFGTEPERMSRIVINLDRNLRNGGGTLDIALRPGDHIFVPAIPSGIQVMGAVASSGTIHFKAGKKPMYYVDCAGGFLRNSDKSETKLVRANGRVLTWNKARGKRVELGDAIVVPTRIKKDKDWWKIFTSTATIVGGLATTVYIVDKL